MHNSTTVLQQMLAFLPEQEFSVFVGQHEADKYVKAFSMKGAQTLRSAEHRSATGEGVLKDERIAFVLPQAVKDYPSNLRMVTYHDAGHDVTYAFLTDMLHLSASPITLVYQCRRDIDLFFQWLKQNLKIKTFFGTFTSRKWSMIRRKCGKRVMAVTALEEVIACKIIAFA